MVDSDTQAGKKPELEGDAMMLPDIPYNLSKERRQIATFAGLNRSEGAADGELTDSVGLSSDDYPALRPRKDDLCEENEATDVFELGGNVVTIRNGVLYYNDDALCNATPHAQFAVCGNCLLVMPDEILVDLEKKTARKYRTSTTSDKGEGTVFFGTNSVTAVLTPTVYKGARHQMFYYSYGRGEDMSVNPVIYTYGNTETDENAAEKMRQAFQGGAWNAESLAALEELHGYFAPGDMKKIKVGDIFIPQKNNTVFSSEVYTPVTGAARDGETPDKALQNADGCYAVVTKIDFEQMDGYGEGWVSFRKGYIQYDVYYAAAGNKSFSDFFGVGDWVTISGSVGGIYDTTAKVVQVDTARNTMYLTQSSVSFPAFVSHWLENVTWKTTGELRFTATGLGFINALNVAPFENATLLYSKSGNKLYIRFNDGTLRTYATAAADTNNAHFTLTAYNPAANGITFSIKAPKLDYICAHQNRIYGVSNADNTLYISALGKPTDFYTYSGDANSYSVAIGSSGDFTAICSYGGGVLVFKESSLVKVFGSTPSDFYTNEYTLSGVQNGSYRSLQVVDETLYYKGVYGVYAYTGGLPTLLSAKLGNEIMTDAVAGSDGMHYYICMKNSAKKHVLYVYDIRRGLWLKDREIQVDSFATVSGKLLMAAEDCLYTLHAGDGITHEWMAEFAPFGDVTHEKKTYTTLRLRMDMQRGSYIAVEVQQDRAAWYTAYTQRATDALSLNVPLRIGRCDRLRVRLRGKGDVTVRSMARELLRGSEV